MHIFNYEEIKIIISLFILFLLIGFCILDGFDIGVCILIPFVGKDDIDKRILINSIAPNWDGNQVWLVTLVGLIFSAWPLVYSTILNYLYYLINIMIISLILRTISLDFRSKIFNYKWRKFWDIIICLSSFFIIFIIGTIIGIIIKGIDFYYDKYMNLNIILNNKINFFSILTGILFVINSIVQGSIYLQIRTKNYIYNISNKISSIFIILQFLITILMIILLSTNINNYIKNPILTLIPAINIILPLFNIILNIYKKNILSFILSSLTISLFIITISVYIFPVIVLSSYNINDSLTIWNSTSSEDTLRTIIFFITIFIPIIISYTIFSYTKMSGKIDRLFIESNKEILY